VRRVLIVDDESTIRAALVRYFTRHGWQVSEASNGVEALALLLGDDPPPDVIVCDVRMPEIGGAEVYARIEADRPELLRRFVFSSGDVVSSDHERFLERSLAPVLQKPFELARLREVVDRVAPPPPPA
jgi:CheY-like chemotaxis protein